MTTPTTQPDTGPREDRDPEEPGPARPRPARHAGLPEPRDRRQVLRPDHLHGVPDVLLRTGSRRDLPARGRWRLRPAQDAEAHQLGHRVRARLDDRACRLHLRHQRGVADALASARPASRGRGVRSAEPALRQVQGRGGDAPPLHRRGRSRAARALRGAGRRGARPVRRAAGGRRARARTRGSSSPTRPAPTWS